MALYKVVDGFSYHSFPVGTIVAIECEFEQNTKEVKGLSCMFTDGVLQQILLWDDVEIVTP